MAGALISGLIPLLAGVAVWLTVSSILWLWDRYRRPPLTSYRRAERALEEAARDARFKMNIAARKSWRNIVE